MRKRRQVVVEGLRKLEPHGVEVTVPQGAFYIFPKVRPYPFLRSSRSERSCLVTVLKRRLFLLSRPQIAALYGRQTPSGTIIANAADFCAAALQDAGLSMVRALAGCALQRRAGRNDLNAR